MRGKLIVIEGLDGSGKATQAKILSDTLKGLGYRVNHISFPDYDSRSSELVKMYLEGAIGQVNDVNAYAASGFYALDRYISYKTIWGEDFENNGTIVIADRYATSNISYQMTKLPKEEWNEYISWLEHNEYELMKLPRPDLTIYLDLSPETSKKLMEKRYHGDESKKDIHEKNLNYLLSCRQSAMYAVDKLNWKKIECFDNKHDIRDINDIALEVLKLAKSLLEEKV